MPPEINNKTTRFGKPIQIPYFPDAKAGNDPRLGIILRGSTPEEDAVVLRQATLIQKDASGTKELKRVSFPGAGCQVNLKDLVFSLDSSLRGQALTVSSFENVLADSKLSFRPKKTVGDLISRSIQKRDHAKYGEAVRWYSKLPGWGIGAAAVVSVGAPLLMAVEGLFNHAHNPFLVFHNNFWLSTACAIGSLAVVTVATFAGRGMAAFEGYRNKHDRRELAKQSIDSGLGRRMSRKIAALDRLRNFGKKSNFSDALSSIGNIAQISFWLTASETLDRILPGQGHDPDSYGATLLKFGIPFAVTLLVGKVAKDVCKTSEYREYPRYLLTAALLPLATVLYRAYKPFNWLGVQSSRFIDSVLKKFD